VGANPTVELATLPGCPGEDPAGDGSEANRYRPEQNGLKPPWRLKARAADVTVASAVGACVNEMGDLVVWATSDTDEHLCEECPQPDGVAFQRCAQRVSTLLCTAKHTARDRWRRAQGVPKMCPYTTGRFGCDHREGRGLLEPGDG
jgi:hypothetical protein